MPVDATRASRTLPQRITAYLARYGRPQHYRRIAEHVRGKPIYVRMACNRMAHDGRLRWVDEGTYTLRREEPTHA